MTYTLQYYKGIIEVKTSGKADLQGIEAIVSHPEGKPGGRYLVDHSEVDVSRRDSRIGQFFPLPAAD